MTDCTSWGAVASVEQITELRRALAAEAGKLRTNLIMGPERISCAIRNGSVAYEARPGSLLVFKDEGACERVFYYIADVEEFPQVSRGRTVVLEEIDHNGRNAQWQESLASALFARGWSCAAMNLQVFTSLVGRGLEVSGMLNAASKRLAENGVVLAECASGQERGVRALWREHLKATDVPASHFRFSEDPAQNVVVALDGEGCVCGVNWWQCAGGVCEIRHTVASPDRQRQGIGMALVVYVLHEACCAGCKSAFTYIDETNSRSLALYGKAGFAENGRTSRQYVLER